MVPYLRYDRICQLLEEHKGAINAEMGETFFIGSRVRSLFHLFPSQFCQYPLEDIGFHHL